MVLQSVDLAHLPERAHLEVRTRNGDVFYLTSQGSGRFTVNFSSSPRYGLYMARVANQTGELYRAESLDDRDLTSDDLEAGQRLVLKPLRYRRETETTTVTKVILDGVVQSARSWLKSLICFVLGLLLVPTGIVMIIAAAIWQLPSGHDPVSNMLGIIYGLIVIITAVSLVDQHAWARPDWLAWLTKH